MNGEYTKLAVGSEYPLANCRGLEGMFFDYRESLATIIFAYPNMTQEELNLIMDAKGRIGLFSYDGIIYVSAKLGYMDGDSAYYVKTHKDYQNISVGEVEDGKGLPLLITAVESTNNVLLGMRYVGMGTRWTRDLGKLIEEQKRLPYTKEEFFQKVEACHRRWSTKQILKLSQTYRIGTTIEEPPVLRRLRYD